MPNTGVKILVVDDEAENCFVIQRALQEEGYEVLSAFSGEEGLRVLQQQAFQLLLLDIRMPGMDGVQVLERIRLTDSELTVIIISAFEHVHTAVRCMRLGAYDYLTKPINVHELKITVANALRTRRLQDEVEALKAQADPAGGLSRLVGDSPAMRQVAALIQRVAPHDITVLITGESGTGKEVVAQAIHSLSGRKDKALVSVDCMALPEHLVESELFGFEKGAFTGATERKQGRFEQANGGTLFLDEIGNLPPATQMKLLRVLQERSLYRLGSKAGTPIDVRIVAATNTDLKQAMRKGEFREDLFHRLNEFTIQVPPLRERGGDIELLANYFLHRFNSQFSRQLKGFTPGAMGAIRRHRWSGNVRELQNAVKRAVILAESVIDLPNLPPEVEAQHAAPPPAAASPLMEVSDAAAGPEAADAGGLPDIPGEGEGEGEGGGSLKEAAARAAREVERSMILKALQGSRWNKREAAKQLQIDYKTLFNKMRELQIE